MAERVFLSHRTVGAHLHQIHPKLGITSRAMLRDVPDSLATGSAGASDTTPTPTPTPKDGRRHPVDGGGGRSSGLRRRGSPWGRTVSAAEPSPRPCPRRSLRRRRAR
ncbi:hypothetical protein ABZV75_05080 [Streptomyces flaveolus]|uniref:hypothetical protein n=1 Tax=Streptomyces flaveolus TaxID=67297 RepID=UPI0033B5599A